MCIEGEGRRGERRWPWKFIVMLIIFVVVLGFALAALRISPEAVAGSAFVLITITAAVKACKALIAVLRTI